MTSHFILLLPPIQFLELEFTLHTLGVARLGNPPASFAVVKDNLLLKEYAWNLNTLWNCPIAIIQGCESSDFNLISDFFGLHKTPFSDLMQKKGHLFREFRLFQTFSHRCFYTPDHTNFYEVGPRYLDFDSCAMIRKFIAVLEIWIWQTCLCEWNSFLYDCCQTFAMLLTKHSL